MFLQYVHILVIKDRFRGHIFSQVVGGSNTVFSIDGEEESMCNVYDDLLILIYTIL